MLKSTGRTLWVDADACPKVFKELLYRFARRTSVRTQFVANHAIYLPRIPNLSFTQVTSDFDAADAYILSQIAPNDLLITADLPLSDGAIEKGAWVVNLKGQLLDSRNIKPQLSLRNFMHELRGAGLVNTYNKPPDKLALQAFSEKLDRWFHAKI